jgi:hypothetical protein
MLISQSGTSHPSEADARSWDLKPYFNIVEMYSSKPYVLLVPGLHNKLCEFFCPGQHIGYLTTSADNFTFLLPM